MTAYTVPVSVNILKSHLESHIITEKKKITTLLINPVNFHLFLTSALKCVTKKILPPR